MTTTKTKPRCLAELMASGIEPSNQRIFASFALVSVSGLVTLLTTSANPMHKSKEAVSLLPSGGGEHSSDQEAGGNDCVFFFYVLADSCCFVYCCLPLDVKGNMKAHLLYNSQWIQCSFICVTTCDENVNLRSPDNAN